MFKFGAIGMGNMGLCILDGALKSGAVKPDEVIVFDPCAERIELAKKRGFAVALDETQVYGESKFLLFAIIPQYYAQTLEKLRNLPQTPEQIVVSIAPGITSHYIREYLGVDKKIVRVMPNTPLMIGCGATALSKTENVGKADFAEIESIFAAMGEVALIPENLMTEIVPANGSSPAFVYYFIECLSRAVAKHGVDYELALKLVAKTFAGSAQMVLQSGMKPQELIEQVCSPGGMTIEAVKVFDERDLYSVIEQGCDACIKRGYELADR